MKGSEGEGGTEHEERISVLFLKKIGREGAGEDEKKVVEELWEREKKGKDGRRRGVGDNYANRSMGKPPPSVPL